MSKNKVIVAVIDDMTCNECLAKDGLDPSAVGYPPFHKPKTKDDVGCRCVVRLKDEFLNEVVNVIESTIESLEFRKGDIETAIALGEGGYPEMCEAYDVVIDLLMNEKERMNACESTESTR